MATETTDFPDLRSYLNAKLASAPAPKNGTPNGTTKSAIEFPPDGGKTPHTGEHFTETAADVKKVVGEGNVESTHAQSEDGKSKNVLPHSGLEQTIAGQEDSNTRAIKTIKDENEKIAKIDLTDPNGIDKALAALDAAQNSIKLAAAPRSTSGTSSTSTPAPLGTTAFDAKQAADQAVYNTTAAYIKYGADRALVTARYLDGFTETWNWLKAAADDGSLAAMLAQGGGGGGAPPDAGAAGGGGAAPMMPPVPAGAGGGAPPDAGAAAGGGGEAGPSPDDVAGGMNEMNLTPEQIQEIIALLQHQLGGAEAPPEQKAAAAESLKFATAVVKSAADHMRSGKYQFKPAADGTPARKSRDTAKKYLGELLAAGGR
jgi:hypothetical protein